MDDELVINLFEESLVDGEFRTRNPEGERFRPLLVDRGNQLVTKVRIVGITHGELAESNDQASLLVFEILFLATGGRRFRNSSVQFMFEDSEGKTNQEPVVHAISPDGKWALNKTEKVQNVKCSVNAGIKAGIEPAGLDMGVHWEVEEVKTRTFCTVLTGTKRFMRRGFFGEENTVIWQMEENEDKADGIPTFMRSAILLRRPHNVPFSFSVKVKADVDFVGKVKTLFGLERKDLIDPVEIDPKNFPKVSRSVVKSLDPTVHNLKQMDNLDLKEVAKVEIISL